MFYQKYKPKDFDQVVGHKTIIKELQKRGDEDNFPNVIYLSGYTGTGKNVIGSIIAKYLLCESKKNNKPCNVCSICKSIDEDKPLLNYSILNASNLGIDDMRYIEENALKKSSLTKVQRKVFYIDELQELASKNKAAVKNLLKILERPSNSSYFILGTMEDNKIDSAIKNRAVCYKLKALQRDDIGRRLEYICENENYKIDTEEKANILVSIAENSNGSLRTGISFLERIIYSDLKTEQEVISELGFISDAKQNEIIDMIFEGNIKVFENQITEDMLRLLIWKMNLYYKAISGFELNEFQKTQLKDIKKYTMQIVSSTIFQLNELWKFSYLTNTIIEFILINIINKNREQSPMSRQPRR